MGLQETLAGYDDVIANNEQSIIGIDEQIAAKQDEKASVEEAMTLMRDGTNGILVLLGPKGDFVHTYDDFYPGGSSHTIDTNLEDWVVLSYILNNNDAVPTNDIEYGYPPIYEDDLNPCYDSTGTAEAFYCDGDLSTTFAQGTEFAFHAGGGIVFGTVSCVDYDASIDKIYGGGTGVTIVNVSINPARSGTTGTWGADVSSALSIDYEYNGAGWDADVDIQALIDGMPFAIDHLYREMGIDSSYGILDMIAKLQGGKAHLETNNNKMSGAQTLYGGLS
ncbi:MAG: hypothetical protein KAS32_20930 [Candidatus Peribacteraceae bacterium]|nr:hypothetical protein [Candidatus Peribacteraceae bacterium]